MLRRLALAAVLALSPSLASADPTITSPVAFIAPTAPVTDNSNRIATTAWVPLFLASGISSLTITGTLTVNGQIIDGNGLLMTNIVAPATPSAGTTRIYVDSTQKNLSAKNDAGTISVASQPKTCSASQWFNALAANGAITCAQPAVTDISGLGTGVATALGNAVNGTGGFNTVNGTATLLNKTIDTAGPNTLKVNGVTLSTGQFPGTTTNDNATAGNFGEYVENVVLSGSAVALTTSTAKTVATISLTAGDWDVSSCLYFAFAATTSYTTFLSSQSLTTNTLDTTPGAFSQFSAPATVPGAQSLSVCLPPQRKSVASTTSVFLIGFATFTVSTLSAYGTIHARRAR